MATVAEEVDAAPRSKAVTDLSALSVAGFASIGAGAIHAAAIGVHSEHHQAVVAFTIVAAFQLGWGAITLVRSNRLLAAVGLLGSSVIVGGWAMAKVQGISFIDGLEESEPVQLADGMAAGLAVVASILALAFALGFALQATRRPTRGLTTAAATLAAVLAVPAMLSAGSHAHAEGAAHGHDGAAAHDDGEPPHDDVAVPAVPYDPTQPIDLGGVDGVTPEQQAQAENIVAITVIRLPKYASTEQAIADGFHSIGDGVTGFEHYINRSYQSDEHILNPDYPESLVYRVEPDGSRTLTAAMFMLKPGDTLDTVPDFGGSLMQWHIHDNLCFTADAKPRVAGLTNSAGECNPPLVKDPNPIPMIHVWIEPHPCGPFAALEGVGAGQIKDGEERLCDHAHGSA